MKEIRSNVHFIVLGDEYAGFVEEGVVGCSSGRKEQGMVWRRAYELDEGRIVAEYLDLIIGHYHSSGENQKL